MAVNAITALNPEIWKPIVQDYLNNMLIGKKICNVKCEAYLASGDQVNFPYVSDVRVQSYAQGTDLVADALNATQDSLIVNQSKVALFVLDPVQERQAKANYGIELARQSAYVLSNNIDQAILQSGVTNASNTLVGGTLTAATLQTQMTLAMAQLFRNNATDGEMWAVMDPERVALLTQTFVANGFNVADSTLRNGFRGFAYGFNVYESNNLPSAQLLTVDTLPTAGDTLTIAGVPWTVVADGTAANPGEISAEASAGAFQTVLRDAINGTGTPGAGTYIDISVDDRRAYQNAQVSMGAFSSDDATITMYGRIAGSETFTAASNVFGTETTQQLFGRQGAMSLAIQMYPELYIRQEPLQIANNYITHTLFGTTTFFRDKKRVVKLTNNA